MRVPTAPGAHRFSTLKQRPNDGDLISAYRRRQVVDLDRLGLAERDRSLNEPFEFANVARPLIRHKRLGSGGRTAAEGASGDGGEEVPG